MVVSLNWEKIKEYLQTTREKIVFIMPSIHKEWINVLKNNPNLDKLLIYTCIDNSEFCIRNGYGDIEPLEFLTSISKEIVECPDLKINFLMFDNDAYFLFLESRILEGAPKGMNAVKLDRSTGNEMISEFFESHRKSNFLFEPEPIAIPLNKEKFNKNKESLKKNPPEKPDLSRKINYYNNLFQFCELSLTGGNISSKTINIPPDAIPFSDKTFRSKIRTRFELFDKQITESWTELNEIKLKVKEIREKYLLPCSVRKEKSILKKENKIMFQIEINALKTFIHEKTRELTSKIQESIYNAEDLLRNELIIFFKNNPLEEYANYNKELKERKINDAVNEIIMKTRFPNSHDLITNIQLNVFFYDMTWEDLNDGILIEWFEKKDLIKEKEKSELAKFNEGYGLMSE